MTMLLDIDRERSWRLGASWESVALVSGVAPANIIANCQSQMAKGEAVHESSDSSTNSANLTKCRMAKFAYRRHSHLFSQAKGSYFRGNHVIHRICNVIIPGWRGRLDISDRYLTGLDIPGNSTHSQDLQCDFLYTRGERIFGCGNNEATVKKSMAFQMKELKTSECLCLGASERSYFCPNERVL